MPGREVVVVGSVPEHELPDVARLWPRAVRAYPALDGPAGRILARRSGLDVMHFTANSGWGTRGPMPFVLTIHDTIFLASGQPRRSPRQRLGHAYWRRNVQRAAAAATRIAAPSETAADSVAAALDLPERPRVIRNGVDLPDAGGLPAGSRSDVVAFGGRDPRKRLDLAYEGWRQAGRPGKLKVLAGAGLPEGFETLAAADVETGRMTILGYQSRKELTDLLAGSRAVVYPSEDEGFGLPVVEAMAAGAPVLTGLCDATREIGGRAALCIDPADPVRSIATDLQRLFGSDELVSELAARGRSWAQGFTWESCAAGYAALYDEALAER